MKQTENIEIATAAAEVWRFIAVPKNMAAWNPKLGSVSRAADAPVTLGERFTAVYVMSGRERASEVEVTACEPERAVAFRHHFADATTGGKFVDESYTLTSDHGLTRVEQVVDLAGAGIPLGWRVVIWLIQSFGRPVEEAYLSRLKRVLEKAPAQSRVSLPGGAQ